MMNALATRSRRNSVHGRADNTHRDELRGERIAELLTHDLPLAVNERLDEVMAKVKVDFNLRTAEAALVVLGLDELTGSTISRDRVDIMSVHEARALSAAQPPTGASSRASCEG